MPDKVISNLSVVAHGILAVFGALAHSLNSYRCGESKTILDIVVLLIISSFSGVIFALIGIHIFGEDSYLTMALAGTGGYLGIEGMKIMIDFLKKVIEKSLK